MNMVSKIVQPVEDQGDYESRKLVGVGVGVCGCWCVWV